MIHRDISPDWRAAAATVAVRALSEGRGRATAPAGTISVRNADGTRTVIGEGAGTDETGAPVGVATFVGDKVPPGRPTGLSWASVAADVTGAWDGTLEGGVPADLAYVELLAGGSVVGRLSRAGSCSAAATVGSSLACTAVAVDVSGNRSEASAATTLTVRDLASEASSVASSASAAAAEAKSAADAAATRAGALEGELAKTNATVEERTGEGGTLTKRVSAAASDATSALAKATEAEQSVSGLSSKVTEAYDSATEALTRASTASQTASEVKSTLTTDYQTKADAERAYATKSELSQTSDSLESSVSEVAKTADGAVASATEAKQTASEIKATLTTDYQTKADAEAAYATKAELTATSDGITSSVASNYQTKGGMSAYATSTELRQTADGLAATASRVASQGEVTAAVERHMSFSADGLVISGGESDGGMSVAVMPDAQEFRSGEDVVMRLDAKTRSVEAARMTLGDYQWRVSDDGSRVSLVYVGGDS